MPNDMGLLILLTICALGWGGCAVQSKHWKNKYYDALNQIGRLKNGL